jgi:DNA-directed RNA polymerase alpha subunit
MKNIFVSCLESRVQEDGKIYGKFFIGPCDFGQGTTLGTALRRSLLSETNGLAIVAVEIRNADHEYSSLIGVRESVLDIILNLKELALAGDIMSEKPCIGFLNVSGPAEVKASHIRFPLGISPIKSDHHIATVAYDGNLSLKVFVIKGTNYMNHSPSTIRKVELLDIVSPLFFSEESSLHFTRKVRDLVRIKKVSQSNSLFATPQTDTSQSYVTAENELDEFSPVTKETRKAPGPFLDYALQSNFSESILTQEKEKEETFGKKVRFGRDAKFQNPPFFVEDFEKTNLATANANEQVTGVPFYKIEPFKKVWRRNPKFISFSQKKENLQLKLFWNEHFKTDSFSLEKDEKSMYQETFLELLENDLNSKRKEKIFSIPSFQKKMLKGWTFSNDNFQNCRKSIPTPFYNIFKKKEKSLYVSSQRKQESRTKNKRKRSILPVDGLFGPIQRVNFRVETDMSSMLQPKDCIILEIWTNGALHPRQALFESAEKLIKSLSNFFQCNPMIYGLKLSHPFVEKTKKDPFPIDLNFWTPEVDLPPALPGIAFTASQNITDAKPLRVDASFAEGALGMQGVLQEIASSFFSSAQSASERARSNSTQSTRAERMGEMALERTSGKNDQEPTKASAIVPFASVSPVAPSVPAKMLLHLDAPEKKSEVQEPLLQIGPLVKEKIKNLKIQGVNSHQKNNSPEFPINILSSEKILKISKTAGALDPFENKTRQSNTPDQLKKESTISRSLYKLDIANLNLPLSLFVKLKNFQIHTIQDLFSQKSQDFFTYLKKDELEHLEKAFKELGIN